nr:unnamed protein product [Spirometra erinaceieuropaei]
MEHRVGAVVTRLCLAHRWLAGWWWNVASASSRRGSAWYAVDQPVGWISELAPSTRAHLVHRRRPQACGNAGESAHSGSLECSFPFRQSEEQPTGTEDGASGTRTGALNVALLSLPAHRLHFSNELAQRLDNLPIAAADDAAAAAEKASVENRWGQLRDTVQSTALAVLGRAPRQHQDWFDDNDAAIRNLLAEKNRLHKAYVDHPTDATKTAFYRSRRQLQQRLREMQDAWTARKAEEIQSYADRNEWKNFFSAIKAVYGPPTKGTAPLLSADGSTLLTEKTQILQ